MVGFILVPALSSAGFRASAYEMNRAVTFPKLESEAPVEGAAGCDSGPGPPQLVNGSSQPEGSCLT